MAATEEAAHRQHLWRLNLSHSLAKSGRVERHHRQTFGRRVQSRVVLVPQIRRQGLCLVFVLGSQIELSIFDHCPRFHPRQRAQCLPSVAVILSLEVFRQSLAWAHQVHHRLACLDYRFKPPSKTKARKFDRKVLAIFLMQ